MADIKIRVGASIDSDLSNVFKPIRDEARRARQQINNDAKNADRDQARAQLQQARDGWRAMTQLNRDGFRAKLAMARDSMKSENDMARDKARAALREEAKVAAESRRINRQANRERLTDFEATVREMRRIEDKAQRDRVRAGLGLGGAGGGGGRDGGMIGYFGGRHMLGSFGRTMGSFGRGAMSIAGGMASGLGVEFDLGSIVRRNTELARKSQIVANAGYQPGVAGPAGTRVAGATLEEESRQVAEKWGLVTTEVADAHHEFVNVTGDLAMSRKLMGELGKMSAATGAEMTHLAQASAKVAVQLPDTPDKAERVLDVMRATLAQGKLGGAELETTAKQMASLAAVSNKFGGDPSKNIKLMGVLYQEAIQHGGAKSPAQAATSIMSFVNTFSKPARLNQMAAMGIVPRDKSGFLGNAEDLIIKLLRKSAGHEEPLSKMVMDVRAKAGIAGFQTAFLRASGGGTGKLAIEAGTEAVRKEFARLSEELENNEEVEKAAAIRMEQADKKAAQFQAALDRIGKGLQEKLGPALERMAPMILQLADGFAKLVEWAASNKFQAAMLAMVAAASKAFAGEMLARAIGGVGSGGAAVGGLGGGAVARGLGNFVGFMGAAGLAVAAWTAAIDQANELQKEMNAKNKISFAPGTSEEEKKRLLNMTPEQKQAELAALHNKGALKAAGYATEPGLAKPEIAQLIDAKRLVDLTDEQVKALQGTLKVEIVNVAEIQRASGNLSDQPPQLDPTATTLPPQGA